MEKSRERLFKRRGKGNDFVKETCADRVLDSVYIGGGTPTTLEPEELERLFLKLQNTLDWSQVREFTVEAGRADSITAEKLRVLKRYGVTRISVNPQTMKQETLDLIGRRHTVAQTVEAFRLAREEGFDNINMDLILGLPGETKEDVEETIRRVQELGPDSLTVHSLAIKRASRLSQWFGAWHQHAAQHGRNDGDRCPGGKADGHGTVLSLPTEKYVRQFRKCRLCKTGEGGYL